MKPALIASVLAATVMPLLAQETPEKAVSAYCASMNGTNFDAAVKHVHPTELAKLKDTIIPFIEKSVQTNGFPPYLHSFTRSNSPEEIAKLTPDEVFTRLVSWYATFQPAWAQAQKRTTVATIGSVKEADNMHVVCRQTTTGMDTNMVRTAVVVVTTMKDNAEWKVVPPPDVQMMAQQMTRMGAMMRPTMRPPPSIGRTPPSSFGPIAPRDAPPPREHSPMPIVTPPPAPPKAPAATPSVAK